MADFDNEKRLIRKLIEEHGVVDETLWSALVRERDTMQAKLDRVLTLARFNIRLPHAASRGPEMLIALEKIAAFLSDAAERGK